MANAERIMEVVEELALPDSEFAVFGGACLALRHIRIARDLELFVTDSIKMNFSLVRCGVSKILMVVISILLARFWILRSKFSLVGTMKGGNRRSRAISRNLNLFEAYHVCL